MRTFKTTTSIRIFDWIVIWILVTAGMSIIQVYTLERFSASLVYPISAFALLFHCIRFKLNFPILRIIFKSWILLLFFIIYIVDLIQVVLISGFSSGSGISGAILRPLGMFLIISYLYNMYRNANITQVEKLKSIINPMIGYSVYNVFVIVAMFALIALGFPWEINDVSNAVLFGGHEGWNLAQFFPYYLCVVADYHSGLLPIPTLMGLSHEPHVVMFMTTPAFIFLFSVKTKWKYLILIPFVFMLGETTSTTAIIVFCIVVTMELLWSGRKTMLLLTLFVVLIGGYLYQQFGDYLIIIQSQVEYKTSGGDTSGETSAQMLQYLFSFSGILGTGNNPNDSNFSLKGKSAGFITGFLDLALFIGMVLIAIKAYLRKERTLHYLGLGTIYFLLHGTKVSYMLFSYPYFAFFVLLTALLQKDYLTKKKKF